MTTNQASDPTRGGSTLEPWPRNAPDAMARATRAAAVGTALALIALGLAWELWLAPTGHGTLALKVAPLVFALPGLARFRLYTYRWLSLLVWLYAAEGLMRATTETPPSVWLAAAEVALALALFAACAAHVRGRLRRGRHGH